MRTGITPNTNMQCYGSLKIAYKFLMSSQKLLTSAKIMGTWKLIRRFFQMFSWCTTTGPNFLFLEYPYPVIYLILLEQIEHIPANFCNTQGTCCLRKALLFYSKKKIRDSLPLFGFF